MRKRYNTNLYKEDSVEENKLGLTGVKIFGIEKIIKFKWLFCELLRNQFI